MSDSKTASVPPWLLVNSLLQRIILVSVSDGAIANEGRPIATSITGPLVKVLLRLVVIVITIVIAIKADLAVGYSEQTPASFVLSEDTPLSIGRGIIGSLSTSTEPVDVLSYGVRFRIPRNYFETILHNTRERIVSFTLVTLFPDFAGVTEASGKPSEQNDVWRWTRSINLIKIYTVGGELAENKNAGWDASVLKAEKDEPDHPYEYGLLKSTKSPIAKTVDIFFQRPTATTTSFVAICNKVLGCRARFRVSDRLLVEYQYHRELLPHWREIEHSVSALVRSFILN